MLLLHTGILMTSNALLTPIFLMPITENCCCNPWRTVASCVFTWLWCAHNAAGMHLPRRGIPGVTTRNTLIMINTLLQHPCVSLLSLSLLWWGIKGWLRSQLCVDNNTAAAAQSWSPDPQQPVVRRSPPALSAIPHLSSPAAAVLCCSTHNPRIKIPAPLPPRTPVPVPARGKGPPS